MDTVTRDRQDEVRSRVRAKGTSETRMRSVELFAGAGGLALGLAAAGFEHDAVLERDKECCATIRLNQKAKVDPVKDWTLYETDVKGFDYSVIARQIDVLSAGPPCQPFSLGGKHRGLGDDRNMFPEVAVALRTLRPRAFIIENVRGILRPAFSRSLEYILLMLRFPELSPRAGEDWLTHHARLSAHQSDGKRDGLSYDADFQFVNATDYGVPQRRERVFIVGFRHDLEVDWNFPTRTHSLDSLLRSKWITGEYWDRHKISNKERGVCPPALSKRLERIKQWQSNSSDLPWQTVRDAIHDLPDPRNKDYSKRIANHWLNPGARAYPGHSGCSMDEPAKVLKAGAHGVPGGENMLAYPSGEVRYFTVRECARLQTFPDNYVFSGAWTRCMRQIGNAVPVLLAESMAKAVHKKLQMFALDETKPLQRIKNSTPVPTKAQRSPR